MEKWKSVSLLIFLGILALLAGALTYPAPFNDALNRTGMDARVPEIPFQLGLDLQGGLHLIYEADLSDIDRAERSEAMEGLRDVLERRVNLFGVQEPMVQIEGDGDQRRLIVELAGIESPERAAEIIGETPFLEFRIPKENYQEIVDRNQAIAMGQEEGEVEEPFESTDLTGRFLESATLGFSEVGREPVIQLQFDQEGSERFAEITEAHIGEPIAIYLDDVQIQAPVVRDVIQGGQAQITGTFDVDEAREVVRNLNAGALPVPISLLSQERVGAALGKQSLNDSVQAASIGMALVLLFMTVFYRLPGLVASVALVFYGVILLALFKLIPVTLTLAGTAGVILSIGMAVDANILIFSRLREELRLGKSYGSSVEEAFQRAWPSIRDGNITTLLVALILFWIGSSFVQGFAFTLALGILISMFTAMIVTKNILRLFEGTFFERFAWLWK